MAIPGISAIQHRYLGLYPGYRALRTRHLSRYESRYGNRRQMAGLWTSSGTRLRVIFHADPLATTASTTNTMNQHHGIEHGEGYRSQVEKRAGRNRKILNLDELFGKLNVSEPNPGSFHI